MKRLTLTRFELVTVILIAAGIGVIFLPALRRIRRISHSGVCGQNLLVLGRALLMYADDNDDKYPTPSKWCDLLIEHTNVSKKQFKCPRSKRAGCSYAMNPNCDVNSHPVTVLLFEADIWEDGGWNKFGGSELLNLRHYQGYACNILYNDSSVCSHILRTLPSLRWGEKEKEESEMEMAVRMGRAALVEEGYRLVEYRLVGISNKYWKGPEHWTVTFKPNRLMPERPSNTPVGTGGEVFVHVNLK